MKLYLVRSEGREKATCIAPGTLKRSTVRDGFPLKECESVYPPCLFHGPNQGRVALLPLVSQGRIILPIAMAATPRFLTQAVGQALPIRTSGLGFRIPMQKKDSVSERLDQAQMPETPFHCCGNHMSASFMNWLRHWPRSGWGVIGQSRRWRPRSQTSSCGSQSQILVAPSSLEHLCRDDGIGGTELVLASQAAKPRRLRITPFLFRHELGSALH